MRCDEPSQENSAFQNDLNDLKEGNVEGEIVIPGKPTSFIKRQPGLKRFIDAITFRIYSQDMFAIQYRRLHTLFHPPDG